MIEAERHQSNKYVSMAFEVRGDVKPECLPREKTPEVVHTFINQHGQTVALVNDNPKGLPVVNLPTEAELRHVMLYGPAIVDQPK